MFYILSLSFRLRKACMYHFKAQEKLWLVWQKNNNPLPKKMSTLHI